MEIPVQIICSLIGLFGTITGLLVGLFTRSRQNTVKEAQREQRQNDNFGQIFSEIEGVKKRLDLHNHYAEKFGEIEKSMVSIKKDIEYLRKGM